MQEDFEKYFEQGNEHYSKGEYNLAIENYINAINNRRTSSDKFQLYEIYYKLGNIFLEKVIYQQSIKYYKKALKINPRNEDILNCLALLYTRRGLQDRSFYYKGKLISDTTILFKLIKGFDFLIAIYYIKKALKINLKSANAYINKGDIYYYIADIYYLKNLFSNSIKGYEKAIEFDPLIFRAYTRIGYIYVREKQYDKAIEYYKKIEKECSNFTFLYEKLGEVYRLIKSYDIAIEYYKKIMELEPESQIPYYNLGIIYCEQEIYNIAIENFNKSIDLSLTEVDKYFYDGKFFYEKEFKRISLEFFRRAIRLSKLSYKDHNDYKEIYEKQQTEFPKSRLLKYFEKIREVIKKTNSKKCFI